MAWVFASTEVVTAEGAALFRPKNLTVEDDSAEGEQRFVTIGLNSVGSLT